MKISKETAILGETMGYPFFSYPNNHPTQEQLYKWISGKKLTIKINEKNYGIYSTVLYYNTIIYKSDNLYDNEEDCIEDGLYQSLKIIKNGKNN